MRDSTFYELAGDIAAAPSDARIADGIAAVDACITVLDHHPNPDMQRAVADAFLLISVAKDAIFPLGMYGPIPRVERVADNTLRDELVALLRAISTALLAESRLSPAIDPMAAARASLLLDDAADALRV